MERSEFYGKKICHTQNGVSPRPGRRSMGDGRKADFGQFLLPRIGQPHGHGAGSLLRRRHNGQIWSGQEKNPTTNYWTANQPAWLDSCVEFFFAPDMSDPLNYLNFEQSLGGALLIQKGTQDDRRYIPHTDEPFKIQKHIDDNGGKSNFSYPFHSFPCITANSTQTLKETSSSATKTKTYTLPGTKLNRRSLHSIVRNSSQTFKCAYSTSWHIFNTHYCAYSLLKFSHFLV